MLSPYRAILSRPGALAFSAAGVAGRFPISTVGLGIVLLVSSLTGSYTLAGTVSAVFLVTNAVCSVVQGRLLDRLGQGGVLTAAVWVFAVSLSLATVSVDREWPHPVTYAAAALAGATMPAVGACVRARWAFVLDRPTEVHTAYALESVLDEAVFVTGPIVVTAIATLWNPAAALGCVVVVALVGTQALATQRRTQPPASGRRTGADPGIAMPWPAVVSVAVVCVALGTLFGAAEVATVGFSDEHGGKQFSGPLLALWAAGSLIAGLVTGLVRWRRGPGPRLRLGLVALAATMLPLWAIDSLPVMALALFVGGFAIAPTLIATNSLMQEVVPGPRLVEGMAIVHTGIAAGVAPGAAAAGVLIDTHGASAAYLVPAVAGVLAALASLATPT